MPERAADTIRKYLRENPQTHVRFLDAITPDSHYLGSSNAHRAVLFVNPVHRALVDELTSTPNPPPPTDPPPEYSA